MLNTVNVIVVKDDLVERVFSFPAEEIEAPKEKFLDVCRQEDPTFKHLSAKGIEAVLADGYRILHFDGGSVCLAHSCVGESDETVASGNQREVNHNG